MNKHMQPAVVLIVGFLIVMLSHFLFRWAKKYLLTAKMTTAALTAFFLLYLIPEQSGATLVESLTQKGIFCLCVIVFLGIVAGQCAVCTVGMILDFIFMSIVYLAVSTLYPIQSSHLVFFACTLLLMFLIFLPECNVEEVYNNSLLGCKLLTARNKDAHNAAGSIVIIGIFSIASCTFINLYMPWWYMLIAPSLLFIYCGYAVVIMTRHNRIHCRHKKKEYR